MIHRAADDVVNAELRTVLFFVDVLHRLPERFLSGRLLLFGISLAESNVDARVARSLLHRRFSGHGRNLGLSFVERIFDLVAGVTEFFTREIRRLFYGTPQRKQSHSRFQHHDHE